MREHWVAKLKILEKLSKQWQKFLKTIKKPQNECLQKKKN